MTKEAEILTLMRTHKDVASEGNKDCIALDKLVGKKIKELRGFLINDGGGSLVFHLQNIVFDDDSYEYIESTDGGAYFYPKCAEEDLKSIYKTHPNYVLDEEPEVE